MGRQGDPLSTSVGEVLEYLTYLFDKGLAYRTIGVHRSMLSSTLDQIDNCDIGKHKLVCRLLKSMFNQRPPGPRYSNFWDVSSVQSRLVEWGRMEDLSLKQLTLKTCFLVTLSSFCRISEVASMSRKDVVIEDSQMGISLGKPRKSQRKGSLKRLKFRRFTDNQLCPVHHMSGYLEKTRSLVARDCNSLFVSYTRPHNPVGASTIGKWIKSTLEKLGVDTTTFAAHSTRGAATSEAFARGTPIEDILAAASWTNASTFFRFYQRPTV